MIPLLLFLTAPVGIPRELALDRAKNVSDIRYKLAYTLKPHANSTTAHEDLTFTLKQGGPLRLDFREGAISKLTVNGRDSQPVLDNGHVVLPAMSAGLNKIAIDFSAPVAPAGKAITRYEDKDDGSEYIYTLFVPMDASMAFPCFDQPDIKGRFTLELDHPADWTVIANVALGKETEPISTYLFAFAAGPFQKVHSVYVRKSQASRAESETPEIEQITAKGMKFLADYFAQPFPFPKYDLVLIPGFPYGGMEHAGATFLNEDTMLFRSAPTQNDRFGRNITVLHELTHQWFGDFTTMRWFDDLWLKEGFAQYMAYRAMFDIAPQSNVWARFYQQIKPAAYGIDITQGTTPIYQNIPNLKDAKSAYGAIVYSKAPGLLRQLAFLLGEEHFRDGLRIYLSEHRYANAQWSDLVNAFERASGQSLTGWANAWIERRGMPAVNVAWTCDASEKLNSLTLSQRNILDEGGTWPIATQILLGYKNGEPVNLRVQFASESFPVKEAMGHACPDYVFANDEDHAYGLFLLDARSRRYVQESVGGTSDLFQRTMMWGELFDAVHFAQMPPSEYLQTALHNMTAEQDESIVRSVSTRSVFVLHSYLSDAALTRSMETLASDRMQNSASEGLRILWFRAFVSVAQTPEALTQLKDLLSGKAAVPGVALRQLDRWRMITALLAGGDPEAESILSAEQKRDTTGIAKKYAYVAMAAKPGAETKQFYFNDYLNNKERPEDWVQDSLGAFNEWNQDRLTGPYLRSALEALPQVKQQRKIFFVVAWLDAFIGGQHTAESSALVHHWLKETKLDPDLRLKVLQVLDELDRTVKIRATYVQ